MIRVIPRRSTDLSYLTNDPAYEIADCRTGPAQWWWRDATADRDPSKVLSPTARSHTVGWDIIVAAPRPASCLLAFGDHRDHVGVVRAHHAAVIATLTYLDEHALGVRRTVLGETDFLPAHFDNVVSFTHGMNRQGEPHLHDHVIVPSHSAAYRRSFDAHVFRQHVAAADAVYRASLRAGIEEHTGRRSWRSFSDRDYVEGVDEGVRALWSGHAPERGVKKLWGQDEARRHWASDLERYEPGPLITPPHHDLALVHEHTFRSVLDGTERVRYADVIEAAAHAIVFGASMQDITSFVDRHYAHHFDPRDPSRWITLREARDIAVVERQGPRRVRDVPQRDRSVPSRERESVSRDRSL